MLSKQQPYEYESQGQPRTEPAQGDLYTYHLIGKQYSGVSEWEQRYCADHSLLRGLDKVSQDSGVIVARILREGWSVRRPPNRRQSQHMKMSRETCGVIRTTALRESVQRFGESESGEYGSWRLAGVRGLVGRTIEIVDGGCRSLAAFSAF